MPDYCALCSQATQKFVKSHVIPQWMYKWMLDQLPHEGRQMKIISSYANEFEKRSQTGIFDSFVCADCEVKFSKWDAYASQILRKQPTPESQGVNYGNYDYEQLKLFFLLILWRMHTSKDNFFEDINIGTAANSLGQCLYNNNLGIDNEFTVIISYSNHPLSCGLLPPKNLPVIDSSVCWMLYLPRFQALIFEGIPQTSTKWEPYLLKPRQPLYMLEKEFTIDEKTYVKNIFSENLKRKQAL